MTQTNQQETVDAIKLMIMGSMLADYGARLMKDHTKQTLKYRINQVIQSVKNVEMHFLNHDQTNSHYREHFKKAFNSNETVLMADLILALYGVNEDGLEEIVNGVKKFIDTATVNEDTDAIQVEN